MKYFRVHTSDIAYLTKQPRGIFTKVGKLVDAKTLTEEETAEVTEAPAESATEELTEAPEESEPEKTTEIPMFLCRNATIIIKQNPHQNHCSKQKKVTCIY